MRKSSKDYRAQKISVNRRIQAEDEAAIKAPPIMNHSAQMLPYTYTSLCLDTSLRTGHACAEARRKKVRHEASR